VLQQLDSQYPRELAVAQTRQTIDALRERLRRGEDADISAVAEVVRDRLDALSRPSLRQIINATGVVLHTNLGRAPLGPVSPLPGYSNLEYDIQAGRRGKRDVHLSGVLEALLGATGIVVNNNAAAVFLALHEIAAGYEVIVSRGELIEIGDGFRIPDIMARSGAVLREIGTTNKTSLADYRDAIGERTRLILRVHPSNFHVEGFTGKPSLGELAGLARERGIPLYEDLGSGCVIDLRPYGVEEPVVRESIEAGVDLVSFSGDKLLGGPQAGILAGRVDLITRIRRNPMFRALRVDKLAYLALETTLRNVLFRRYDRIPAIAMIMQTAGQLRARADRLGKALGCDVIEGRSVIGGGSTPAQSLPTWLLALNGDAVVLEERLRAGEPPVIARIEDDRVVLDLRTVAADEEEQLIAAVNQARSR